MRIGLIGIRPLLLYYSLTNWMVGIAGQSQSRRNIYNIVVRELTDPIPGPSSPRGEGCPEGGKGCLQCEDC